MERISRIIQESVAVHRRLLGDEHLLASIGKICQELVEAFARGNKVLLCGNGGSAADAQHIAAELSGKFFLKRKPLCAEALHVNTMLKCCGTHFSTKVAQSIQSLFSIPHVLVECVHQE